MELRITNGAFPSIILNETIKDKEILLSHDPCVFFGFDMTSVSVYNESNEIKNVCNNLVFKAMMDMEF
jgi:hypothetical protein